MTEWTATPQQVERVIAAVLPHTAADRYVPTITCVNIEIADGQFTAAATDRYTMGVSWAKLADWSEDNPASESITACVFARDLKRLFTFVRPQKKDPAVWTLTDKSLTVAIGGESISVRTAEVEFPKWRTVLGGIVEKHASGDPAPVIAFTPAMVEHFTQTAKVLGYQTMVWRMGPSLTAPIIHIGDSFMGLLMPCRMPDGPPELDLSALGIESPKPVAA